jgi:hypothetical protein
MEELPVPLQKGLKLSVSALKRTLLASGGEEQLRENIQTNPEICAPKENRQVNPVLGVP